MRIIENKAHFGSMASYSKGWVYVWWYVIFKLHKAVYIVVCVHFPHETCGVNHAQPSILSFLSVSHVTVNKSDAS